MEAVKTSSLKIGELNVNITSTFNPQKNLYEIMLYDSC